MRKFLSCDWGTTSFRLRLVETERLTIIEEENTKQGIAETFQKWKQSQGNEETRLGFYLDIIAKHIKAIEERSAGSLDDVPLIISGMASSTVGMVDLPYKNLPFSATGEDLEIFTIDQSAIVKNKVLIISGVRTKDDVIRGEETKLVGCAAVSSRDDIYIFPGTHPKYVEVKDGRAIAFKTYMTGEFFELLSQKSILSVSVKKGESLQAENNFQSFAAGVNEGINSNILHSSFLVRTNDVFKKYSLEENYFYLSGLLLGTELKDLIEGKRNLIIVGNEALTAQYLAALKVLGLPGQGIEAQIIDADKALIAGQWQVYKNKFPDKDQ